MERILVSEFPDREQLFYVSVFLQTMAKRFQNDSGMIKMFKFYLGGDPRIIKQPRPKNWKYDLIKSVLKVNMYTLFNQGMLLIGINWLVKLFLK